MKVTINGKEYTFLDSIRDNEPARKAYCELAYRVFPGLEFEPWYNAGYWDENYLPQILFDGGKAAANVSVSIMDFDLNGKRKRFVQLGAVMSAPEYRGMELVKWLMNKTVETWRERCDLLFLFGGDDVVNFYPKFGFKATDEYLYHTGITNAAGTAKKLDMSLKSDVDLLLRCYKKANPFSMLTALDNPGLLMFFCSKYLKDNVYYLPKDDTALIMTQSGDTACVYDIFCDKNKNFNSILSAAAFKGTKHISLGFAPKPELNCSRELLHEEDSTMFVHNSSEKLFENSFLRIPLLSHT